MDNDNINDRVEEKESAIEFLASGDQTSDAVLVALKRLSKETQEWIDGLGGEFPCLLCGANYYWRDR